MRVDAGPVQQLGISPEQGQAFVNEHWKRSIAVGHPVFYRWQFIDPPINEGRDSCWAVADVDGGETLAFLGFNHRPFVLNQVVHPAGEMTTFLASPHGIRLGAGARLLQALQERHSLLMGMSLSSGGTISFLRAGFRILRAVPRFVRVYNLEKIQAHALLTAPAEKLIRAWLPRGKNPTLSSTLSWVPSTATGVALCDAWLREHANAYLRDEAHVVWRYDRHPFFTYHRVEIHTPSGPAQVVFRVQDVSGFRMMHLTDFYGPGVAEAMPMLDQLALEHGADVADFFCTHGGINRHFYASGWFSNNDDTCFRFPHLFNPIELREPLTNSLCFWSRDHMAELSDLGRFYITKEDMDFDRPAGDLLQKDPRI